MTTQMVTVVQGAQPNMGGVDIGIMQVGLKDGVPTARLWLRRDVDSEVVDIAEGDECDLLGSGTLRLDEVHEEDERIGKRRVTLTWRSS